MANNKHLIESWKNDKTTIKSFNDIPCEVVDEINSTDYDVDWGYYFSGDFGDIEKLQTFRLDCKISYGDYSEKKVTSAISAKTFMGETASGYMVRGVVNGNSFYPVVIITLNTIVRS